MRSEPLPTAALGELVVQCTEKASSVKDPAIPYVGLEHLASGSPDLLGAAHSSTSLSTNNVFRSGDVLFGKLRPYLRKSSGATFMGYCSTDILVLRAAGGVDPRFVAKIFQTEHVFSEAIATSIGTKMPRTSWRDLRNLQVFCPRLLAEQRRIAEILDTLDEAIRRTQHVIAKLKQMKLGLLHDLLTRGIDDNGELRDPQRHPQQFGDSPLGQMPREWIVAPFADYQTTERPFLKTGPFGSSLKGEHWVNEGVPVITIGALGEGTFIERELLFVSDRTAARLSAYVVRPGDIVFSRVADVGRSVVVRGPQDGWIMSSNLMWISLDQERVSPDYVQFAISGSDTVRTQIRRFVNAGGREVANGPILRSLIFAWPSLTEQRRIVAAVGFLAKRVQDEVQSLAKLGGLKRGLMDDLLTGRVRVKLQEDSL